MLLDNKNGFNEFNSQGHRFKFKSTRLENVIFGLFYSLVLILMAKFKTLAIKKFSILMVISIT